MALNNFRFSTRININLIIIIPFYLISDIFKNYKIYEESDQQENILRVYDCNYFQEQKEGEWMSLNEEHL